MKKPMKHKPEEAIVYDNVFDRQLNREERARREFQFIH